MITITHTNVNGWDAAIRGMRNPMNSWAKSDSGYGCGTTLKCDYCGMLDCASARRTFVIGENDLSLMRNLASAGTDHGKFMRFINVTVDITAPLYWWKEFDTYKVGTVANSCSTMHKIHAKEFTPDDFSIEHLTGDTFFDILDDLNFHRQMYLDTGDHDHWWQLIQLLPTSYNQLRTVQVNYAVLRNIYHARKNHKLTEWRSFCEWIEKLPYAKELICDGNRN